MKSLKPIKKGMTLIEVIISIAILGIMAVSFLDLFSMGIKSVFKAGTKSSAEFKGQKAMEERIAKNLEGAASDMSSDTNVTSSDTNIDLKINFNGTEISSKGKIKKIIYDDGKDVVEFTTFIPDK